MVNDRVLPFYNEQDVPVLRILTDRGTEYKGKIENHAVVLVYRGSILLLKLIHLKLMVFARGLTKL